MLQPLLSLSAISGESELLKEILHLIES